MSENTGMSCHFLLQGNLPDPGIEPPSPALQEDSLPLSHQASPTYVRPHRWPPTRFPHPWDSPGKNTGVGCHFLLQCIKVKSESEVTQSCPTLGDPMDCSLPGSSVNGIFQARVVEWGAIAFSIKARRFCYFFYSAFPVKAPMSCTF